ncbi:MAG: class II aldolase/adducin family protein, partial [Propionivibrio sp.]
MNEIDQLIAISRHYGADSRFVIAGGGNTSFKNAEKLWIKASGAPLATITEDGFAILDREKLRVLPTRKYSMDNSEREEQVKNDLASACISHGRRPSVETSLHDAISFQYVVHLHPTVVNALMCANHPEDHLRRLFGEKVLYIPYTDPGYVLFKVVGDSIAAHRKTFGAEPAVIWLQNHGIFVGADTVDEIKQTYTTIIETLENAITTPLPAQARATSPNVERTLPGLRMMLSADGLKTLKVRTNSLIELFSDDVEKQARIARPFTPDAIVYCKSNVVFMNDADPESLLAHAAQEVPAFFAKHGYLPKVIVIKDIGLVAVGDNAAQCEIILDVFEDAMKIAFLAD